MLDACLPFLSWLNEPISQAHPTLMGLLSSALGNCPTSMVALKGPDPQQEAFIVQEPSSVSSAIAAACTNPPGAHPAAASCPSPPLEPATHRRLTSQNFCSSHQTVQPAAVIFSQPAVNHSPKVKSARIQRGAAVESSSCKQQPSRASASSQQRLESWTLLPQQNSIDRSSQHPALLHVRLLVLAPTNTPLAILLTHQPNRPTPPQAPANQPASQPAMSVPPRRRKTNNHPANQPGQRRRRRKPTNQPTNQPSQCRRRRKPTLTNHAVNQPAIKSSPPQAPTGLLACPHCLR